MIKLVERIDRQNVKDELEGDRDTVSISSDSERSDDESEYSSDKDHGNENHEGDIAEMSTNEPLIAQVATESTREVAIKQKRTYVKLEPPTVTDVAHYQQSNEDGQLHENDNERRSEREWAPQDAEATTNLDVEPNDKVTVQARSAPETQPAHSSGTIRTYEITSADEGVSQSEMRKSPSLQHEPATGIVAMPGDGAKTTDVSRVSGPQDVKVRKAEQEAHGSQAMLRPQRKREPSRRENEAMITDGMENKDGKHDAEKQQTRKSEIKLVGNFRVGNSQCRVTVKALYQPDTST